MLTKRIIPCLDVRDGAVVKGVQFQNLRTAGDPVALARAYQQQGADEIVVLDVSATPAGRDTCWKTVAALRQALSIPLCVGGGIRTIEDAQLALASGADKVAVNSAAVERPEILSEMSALFGRQCVVASIDACHLEGSWEVLTHSGKTRTGRNAIEWTWEVEQRGAGEILLTSWDRDGTREGYDVDLILAASRSSQLPIIASGGADCPEHMQAAFLSGADAVLAASIFHDGDYCVQTIKEYLQQNGTEVRL